jgi:hypothetical protein
MDAHPALETPPNAGCTINRRTGGLLLDIADVSVVSLCCRCRQGVQATTHPPPPPAASVPMC